MWYCVIRIADSRIVYHGQDKKAADKANVDGTHSVTGKNYGDSVRDAAIESGYLRRDVPIPKDGA